MYVIDFFAQLIGKYWSGANPLGRWPNNGLLNWLNNLYVTEIDIADGRYELPTHKDLLFLLLYLYEERFEWLRYIAGMLF